MGGVTVPGSGDQRQVDTSLSSADEELELSVGIVGVTKGVVVTGGITDEAVSSTSSSEEEIVWCEWVDMVLL